MDNDSLSDDAVDYLSVSSSPRPFTTPFPSKFYTVGYGGESCELQMLDFGRRASFIAVDVFNRIILTRTFRLGGHLTAGSASMIDLPTVTKPSGTIFGDWDIDSATRHFTDLMKVRPSDVQFAFNMMPSPAVSTEHIAFFVVSVDSEQLPSSVEGDLTVENFDILKVPIDEALQALRESKFISGTVIAGLQWVALKFAEPSSEDAS